MPTPTGCVTSGKGRRGPIGTWPGFCLKVWMYSHKGSSDHVAHRLAPGFRTSGWGWSPLSPWRLGEVGCGTGTGGHYNYFTLSFGSYCYFHFLEFRGIWGMAAICWDISYLEVSKCLLSILTKSKSAATTFTLEITLRSYCLPVLFHVFDWVEDSVPVSVSQWNVTCPRSSWTKSPTWESRCVSSVTAQSASPQLLL